MIAFITKIFTFDAAHQISTFPDWHRCRRLHGHSWKVNITVSGVVSPETGIVLDYHDISEAWKPVYDMLDHRYLNEIAGLELPTTENLARWIWLRMEPALTSPNNTYKLSKVVIQEGDGGFCEFLGAL